MDYIRYAYWKRWIIRVFILCHVLLSPCFVSAKLISKERDGLWGYVNEKGKWEINPKYHRVGNFNDELAPVMKYYNHNGAILRLWGYINQKGQEVIPLKYDYASDFYNGVACVGYLPGTHWEAGRTTNLLKMRLVDINGNESDLAKDCFNYAVFDRDSITLVKNVFTISSYGYRDTKPARLIRSIQKSNVSYKDIHKSFILKTGEVGITFIESDSTFVNQIDSINSIPKTLFLKRGDDIVYIPNNSILEIITEDLQPIGGVISPKSAHGMWGFVNKSDEWVIPAMYDYTEHRKSDGNNSLHKDYISSLHYVHGCNGWGAIDTLGHIFIRPIYDSIQPLHGYAKRKYYFLVSKDGNHGLINENGSISLPINKYRQDIEFFPEINRMLYADENGLGTIADSLGVVICTINKPIHWNSLSPQSINNRAIQTGDWGSIGAVDWNGNEIIPHVYEFVYFDDEFITVRTKEGFEGAYSYSGENIIPVKFKSYGISSIGLMIGVKQDNTYDMHLFDLRGNPIIYNGKHLIVHSNGRRNWSNNFFALATDNGYILCFEKGSKLSKYTYNEVEWLSQTNEVVAKRFDKNNVLVVEKYDENGNFKPQN